MVSPLIGAALIGGGSGLLSSFLGNKARGREAAAAPRRAHEAALEFTPKHNMAEQKAMRDNWLGTGAPVSDVPSARRIATAQQDQELSYQSRATPVRAGQVGAEAGARLDAVMSRGGTLQEALGVSGGNPSAGGQAATLGNGPQTRMAGAQQANIQNLDFSAGVDIAKAKIAAKATTDSAAISAGASKHSTDVNANTQRNAQEIARWAMHNLDDRERRRLKIAADMYKIAREKGDRDRTTQTAAFILHKILMTAGPENTRTLWLNKAFEQEGYSLTDMSGKLVSPEKLKEILRKLRAEGSHTFTETSGVWGIADLLIDQLGEVRKAVKRRIDKTVERLKK